MSVFVLFASLDHCPIKGCTWICARNKIRRLYFNFGPTSDVTRLMNVFSAFHCLIWLFDCLLWQFHIYEIRHTCKYTYFVKGFEERSIDSRCIAFYFLWFMLVLRCFAGQTWQERMMHVGVDFLHLYVARFKNIYWCWPSWSCTIVEQ